MQRKYIVKWFFQGQSKLNTMEVWAYSLDSARQQVENTVPEQDEKGNKRMIRNVMRG